MLVGSHLPGRGLGLPRAIYTNRVSPKVGFYAAQVGTDTGFGGPGELSMASSSTGDTDIRHCDKASLRPCLEFAPLPRSGQDDNFIGVAHKHQTPLAAFIRLRLTPPRAAVFFWTRTRCEHHHAELPSIRSPCGSLASASLRILYACAAFDSHPITAVKFTRYCKSNSAGTN